MSSFIDTAGRRWAVEVNTVTAKRVRKTLNVDVLRLFDDQMKPLGELLSNPIDFVDVLYVLCQEEADRRDVSDEDFGRSLGGGTLDKAADAFLEALADFFPPERGKALRTAFNKVRKASLILTEQAQKRLDELSPEELAKLLGGLSGNAPASSDSTPDPSPSVN